ncbi:MAG: FIG01197961: hypothetical protein, partial [uncultured Chloroflexi bacterium]
GGRQQHGQCLRSRLRAYGRGAALEGEDSLDQPGELQRREGQGGHGHRGHRRHAGTRPRPGLEDLSFYRHRARAEGHPGRDRGPRRHPAHLAHRPPAALAPPHPALLLGRRRDSLHRSPRRRLLLQRLVRAVQRQLAPHRRQPRRRHELLLAHAVPQVRPHHHGARAARRKRRRARAALLSGHLRPGRRARRCRLLSRPVAPRQPAGLQGRAHTSRRSARAGPV